MFDKEWFRDREAEVMARQATSTCSADNVLTLDKLNKLVEDLKPKKIIYTPDEELYKSLLELPYMDTRCVKLMKQLDQTIVVDMEKLEEIIKIPLWIPLV